MSYFSSVIKVLLKGKGTLAARSKRPRRRMPLPFNKTFITEEKAPLLQDQSARGGGCPAVPAVIDRRYSEKSNQRQVRRHASKNCPFQPRVVSNLDNSFIRHETGSAV